MINKIRSFLILLKASTYLGKSQYQDVIDLSRQALNFNPKNEMAFLYLGDCYSRLGRYEESIQILEESLQLIPGNFETNYTMATSIVKSERPNIEAVPYLEAFLDQMPKEEGKFPFFMNWLAKIFRKDFDFNSYGKQLDAHLVARKQWAEKTINHIKTNN